jgi:hypothetical protein
MEIMMDPLELLKNAIAAVPAMKYALGVVGLIAVIAIVSAFKIDYRVAVFGAIIIIFLMVILLIFAKLSGYTSRFFAAPALVFTWFSLILLIAISVALFTSVFFQKPINLQSWIQPRATQSIKSVQDNAFKYRRVYYESFHGRLEEEDPLSPIWLLSKRGDWSGSINDGRYRICNIADNPNSSYTSRLSYKDDQNIEQDLSNAKVKVRVEVQGNTTGHSGAGILYRKDQDKTQYYAFLLQAGGTVSLYQAKDGAIRILWSDDVSSLMTGNSADLEVVGNGQTITLFFNNNLLHTLSNAELVSGNPGVFAYSRGCFIFDNMAVYQPVDAK